jgi:hypothetical protein
MVWSIQMFSTVMCFRSMPTTVCSLYSADDGSFPWAKDSSACTPVSSEVAAVVVSVCEKPADDGGAGAADFRGDAFRLHVSSACGNDGYLVTGSVVLRFYEALRGRASGCGSVWSAIYENAYTTRASCNVLDRDGCLHSTMIQFIRIIRSDVHPSTFGRYMRREVFSYFGNNPKELGALWTLRLNAPSKRMA